MSIRFSKILVLVIGIVGLVSIQSLATEKNLLSNPGFEQGESNWDAEWGKTCFMDQSIIHSGTSSLKIVLPEGRHHVTVEQTIKSVKPDTRYMLGGWSKSDGGSYTYFIVWFRDENNKELQPQYLIGGEVKSAHPWTESSFVFQPPSGTATMVVQCGIKNPGATAWFDDLYLREVSASHVENNVVNSSFEIERTPGYPVGWNRSGYNDERRYFEPGYWGLDKTTSFHGKQSLKVAAPLTTISCDCKMGLILPYTFSIYLKSNRPDLECEIGVGRWRSGNERKTVIVGTSWKKYSIMVHKCSGNPVVIFTPKFPHESVNLEKGPVLWADAAQVESGETPHDYTPDKIDEKLLPPQKKESKTLQIYFTKGDENMFPASGIVVGGQPFIPYWEWGLRLEDSAKLKEWGINCIFCGVYADISLDKVKEHGLKGWECLPWPRRIKGVGTPKNKSDGTQTREEYFAELKELIQKLKDHPALVGWFICDEPDNPTGVPPELIEAVYNTIKEIDPVHPAFINWGISPDIWKYKDQLAARFKYSSGTDILCGDPYPIPYTPIDCMARITDAFIQEAKGRPVFMVPQFFGDWADYYSSPTPEEETGMVYLSLIHGTRGFSFYTHRPVSIPLWESMLRAGKEIKELTSVLFSSESTGLSGQTPDGYSSGVHCLPRKYKGKLYLITVNAEFRDTQTQFALVGLKAGSEIKVLFEDRSIKAEEGSFSDLFGPYQRHVYEITKR